MADNSRSRTLPHLLRVLFAIWLGMVLYVALWQVSGLLTERGFEPHFLGTIRYLTIYFWAPWFLTAPLVVMLARRMPIRPDNWLLPICANVGLCLAISLLDGLVASYVYHVGGNMSADMATYAAWQHTGHFLFGDDMFLLNTIAYAVLAADLNIGKFHEIVRQKELDEVLLRENLAQLKLQTLRMQINPHFLFNSLNAVCVLVNKNERASAVEMISKMSSFFRRTLEGSGDQWVTLESELDMVSAYLGIAQFRFGERLRITQECDSAARDLKVPSMLLQPLVENAVMHGIAERPGECKLEVRCSCSGERLSIRVSDDGVGSRPHGDPAFKEGIGLRNVRQRLEQLYGADHSFVFASEPGGGTQVTIEIPARPSARAALRVAAL